MGNVIFKFKRFLKYLKNKKVFGEIAKSTTVFLPIRVDGGENISIGMNTVIQSDCWFLTLPLDNEPVKLYIGNGCQLGHRNHITAVRSVVLGEKVLTACNVYISDNYHEFKDIEKAILDQPVRFKKEVEIGDGSWLGENVCIVGASVGKNCVIGANSVVTKDIPDYCVAVGAPAKVIRHYSKKDGCWRDGIPQD